MIDRQRVSPLYLQIKKQIIADIESHKYPEGSQIPSEGELEQKYGVSRITVRRAVSELVTENFLVKKQGRGTYVQQPRMVRNLLSLDSYTHYRESLGERPERHVVKNEIVMADSRIAEELGVAEGAEVFTLGRVMLLSPGNSGYEESIYSVDLFPQLNQLVNDDSSMTKLLKERYGATMGKDSNMINVVSATTEIAELTNVGVAEPVYQVDKTTFSNTGSILYHSTMFYDARKVSFVVEN